MAVGSDIGGASREHRANPRSVGDVVGRWRTGEPRDQCATGPHPLCSAGHRGPPTLVRLGIPDQDAVKGTDRPVGVRPDEINLTGAIKIRELSAASI